MATTPDLVRFMLCLLMALGCGALVSGRASASQQRPGEFARDRYEDDDDRDDDRDDYGDDENDDDDDRRRGRDAIPRDARLVQEGKGTLEYTAPRDGRVYLYDPDLDKLIYSGTLYQDEVFTVEPERNRVQVDGRTVKDKIMKKKHSHRLYFLRDRWRGR